MLFPVSFAIYLSAADFWGISLYSQIFDFQIGGKSCPSIILAY